jgi:hypothetical protein
LVASHTSFFYAKDIWSWNSIVAGNALGLAILRTGITRFPIGRSACQLAFHDADPIGQLEPFDRRLMMRPIFADLQTIAERIVEIDCLHIRLMPGNALAVWIPVSFNIGQIRHKQLE